MFSMQRAPNHADDTWYGAQIGEHFDGISPGASSYTPNRYLASLYPQDSQRPIAALQLS